MTEDPGGPEAGRGGRLRSFLRAQGTRLWWLHSLYALGLGITVVLFARRGFAYARWLTVFLVAGWLVTLLLFRLFGSGAARRAAPDSGPRRVGYYVMTYVLKNLYQTMLFFALPFYWQATTFDSSNRWFVVALGACAVVSTLDLVFDRMLMRWRALASTFYVFVLFAALDLAIPALWPGVRLSIAVTGAAGAAALAFWTIHVPPSAWRRRAPVLALLGGLSAATGAAWATQRWIPPVPLHLESAAVGPETLPDGRLAVEWTAACDCRLDRLHAVTVVGVPPGAVASAGDFRHVWRRDGEPVLDVIPALQQPAADGSLRLTSTLAGKSWPPTRIGPWTVDLETAEGQLVGRARLRVFGKSVNPDRKRSQGVP